MPRLTLLAPPSEVGACTVTGLLGGFAGLPWQAVLALALTGVITTAALKIVREVHRHREAMSALAKADAETPLVLRPRSLALGATHENPPKVRRDALRSSS